MHRVFEGGAIEITPIKARCDYRHALKRIESLMTAKRGTREGDPLDVLVTLVEAWERWHCLLDLPQLGGSAVRRQHP